MSRAQGNRKTDTSRPSPTPKAGSQYNIYWDEKRQCGSSFDPHNVSVTYMQCGRKTSRGTSDVALIHVPLKSLNNCAASNPIRLFSEGDGFTVRFHNDSLPNAFFRCTESLSTILKNMNKCQRVALKPGCQPHTN